MGLETGPVVREASDRLLDDVWECTVEIALKYVDANKEAAEIVGTSLAPEGSAATIRKKARDWGVLGADHRPGAYGCRLACDCRGAGSGNQTHGFYLVIAGNLSTDGTAGVLPSMIAKFVGMPQLMSLSSIDITDSAVSRAPHVRFIEIERALRGLNRPVSVAPDTLSGVTHRVWPGRTSAPVRP